MINKIKRILKENIGFIITLIIILLVFNIELPYAIYTPGGEVDLNKRVKVEKGYESKGKFGMAYVSMVKSSIPFVLASFVIPNWDLEKVEDFTYKDMTVKETMELDKVYLEESISNATYVAYKKANKDIKVTDSSLNVIYIDDNAKTDLKLKDIIISVEDVKVSSITDIQNIVKNYNVGDELSLTIKRNGKEMKVSTKLIDIAGEPKIGISTVNTMKYDTKPKISIKTKSTESGPSGGLMMSLAIYNALVKKDITHGKNIVGTGTIDIDGNVGEIDGVKYKLIGAVKNDADIFICPEKNYKEAIKIKKEKKYDIIIVKVKTFDDAIKYLENLK